ncbi:hypothetical protein MSG28_011326 [Choristoneura fumiferana]|uniref:Uncharacterized protein n=1 Tax=Choristoneura fumiferana TaxID=7141 RepID=A0ACC0KR08_CHOFU|nr:hypothetical protein MSG28_011326 [Choristoneura fumiferana]
MGAKFNELCRGCDSDSESSGSPCAACADLYRAPLAAGPALGPAPAPPTRLRRRPPAAAGGAATTRPQSDDLCVHHEMRGRPASSHVITGSLSTIL